MSAWRSVGLLAGFGRHERPWSRTELRGARTPAVAAGPVVGTLAGGTVPGGLPGTVSSVGTASDLAGTAALGSASQLSSTPAR